MSITVNGYTLNDVGEATDWSPVEVALLTLHSLRLPPAGTVLVTTEHRHARLYGAETGEPLVTLGATISLNAQSADVDTVVAGSGAVLARFDAGAATLHLPDDQKLAFGATAASPDAKIYSDGTRLRVNGVPDGSVHYASLASGDLYYSGAAAGTDQGIFRKT